MLIDKGLYFQFPVSALALDVDFDTLLEIIVDYCVVELGRKAGEAEEPEKPVKTRIESNARSDAELHAHRGAEILGVPLASIQTTLKRHRRLASHAKQFDGDKALVRIKQELFLEVYRKHRLSEREFRILVAIYSAIGSEPARRITHEQIQRRSSGYSSARIEDEYAKGTKPRYTIAQIKRTVQKLHCLKFFEIARPNRRHNYYSITLRGQALDNWCAAKYLRKMEFKAKARERDRALQERIRSQEMNETVSLTEAIDDMILEEHSVEERGEPEFVKHLEKVRSEIINQRNDSKGPQ